MSSQVLIIADCTDTVYRTRYQLLERLRVSGHDVRVVAAPSMSDDRLRGMGCTLYWDGRDSSWKSWRTWRRVLWTEPAPQMVISLGLRRSWLASFFFCRRAVPVLFLDHWPVTSRHRRFSWLSVQVLRWYCSFFAKVIFPDHYLLQQSCQSGWVKESQAVVIEGDGVRVSALPELVVEKSSPFGFLCVVDHVQVDMEMYSLAVRALRKKYPQQSFVFPVIVALPASDQAAFVSRLPAGWQEMYDLIAYPEPEMWAVFMESIHVVVTLSEHVGYPRTACQAAVFSKPMIAPKTPFFQSYMEGEQGGLLFTPGDAQSLAEVMHRLLTCEPFDRRQKGQWLATYVADRCDDRRVVRRYREVFRGLMGGRFME